LVDSGQQLVQFSTNIISVKNFNARNPVIDYIQNQHAYFATEFNASMPWSPCTGRLWNCIEGCTEIITTSTPVYDAKFLYLSCKTGFSLLGEQSFKLTRKIRHHAY